MLIMLGTGVYAVRIAKWAQKTFSRPTWQSRLSETMKLAKGEWEKMCSHFIYVYILSWIREVDILPEV